MTTIKRKGGRPELKSGKRTKIIKARLTEEEFKSVLLMESTLGITRMELIRTRVLHDSNKVFVNSGQLLILLDEIGTELGRSGNNINQLAKHANVLNKQGSLNDTIVDEFNPLFKKYIQTQQNIEAVIRQIIRLMKK